MTTYKVQIDDLIRDATSDEIAEIKAREAAEQLQNQAIEAKAATRQAVLDKLGLTADEVAALLS
jgi:hypothetical protein